MTIFGYRIPMMASLLVWCALWEIAGQARLSFFLPPLSSVLVAGAAMLQTASFQAATLTTASTFLTGMAISIGFGVPIGLLMGRVSAIDNLLGMWVNLFASAPLSAVVPILMMFFGLGDTTVVATVVMFAIWIIVLDVRAGVMHVPPSLVEMARGYGATPIQLYVRIILWSALPEILAGIRLGLIRGVKGVVVGQILVAIVGYGALFEQYSRGFDMERFWALAVLLFAFALAISTLVEILEKKVEFFAGVR